MNYTKNHHLPQWVTSDRVKMDDFNAAMANIENGLNTADSALTKATAAQSTATAAQSTANSANTKATAAQTAASAAYTPSNKPYVVGTYTGTGKTLAIHVEFEPSFLIISGMAPEADGTEELQFPRYFAITGGTHLNTRVQLMSYGFVVYPANNHGMSWPMLTEPDRVYTYIAFR